MARSAAGWNGVGETEATLRALPWLQDYLAERDRRIVATVGETQTWTVDRRRRPDGLVAGVFGSGTTLTLAVEAKSFRLLRQVVVRYEEGDGGRTVALGGIGALVGGVWGLLIGLGLAALTGGGSRPRVIGQLGRYPANFRVVVVPEGLLADVPKSRRKLVAAYRREGVGLLEVGGRNCGLLAKPRLVRNVEGGEWLEEYARAGKIRRRLFELLGRNV